MTEISTTDRQSAALDKALGIKPAAGPEWVSQGTAIEQTRAIAEVQAAVIVAQEKPRDVTRSIAEMRTVTQIPSLADRAFYRYARAGQQVTGATVHLARELARCWGNVTYGLTELRRDDEGGFSEMQAWAWDLQTNARTSHTFIVPHVRDTRQGRKSLTDVRDIYEVNANMGARRVREAIFAILPVWFTEEAKQRCSRTIANPGDGKTFEQRVADMVITFQGIGVGQRQLEDKIGRSVGDWTDADLATLRVIGSSIRAGEVSIEDEFPSERVTAKDLQQAATPAKTPASPASARDPWATDEEAPDVA